MYKCITIYQLIFSLVSPSSIAFQAIEWADCAGIEVRGRGFELGHSCTQLTCTSSRFIARVHLRSISLDLGPPSIATLLVGSLRPLCCSWESAVGARAMFNSILKDHRTATAGTRKQLDGLRAQALQSSEVVTHHLFHEVQSGVGLIYKNQRVLQQEAATLQAHTTRFAKQSERWRTLSAQLNTSLKELGDVHNWALTIQKDMRWVEQNLAEVVHANNATKIAIKSKKDEWTETRRAEREEQERVKREEKERRMAAKNPYPPAATTPQETQQQAATSPMEHVDGDDEELP